MDDDLVCDLNSLGFPTQVDIITRWLVREVKRAIDAYKDYLPEKAKHDYEPQIIWIAPPMHKHFGDANNRRRAKHDEILHEVILTQPKMVYLKMLKEWDYHNGKLYIYDSDRFTSEGLYKYWESIDAAIRYWDMALHNKIAKKTPTKKVKKTHYPAKQSSDRLHWKRKDWRR